MGALPGVAAPSRGGAPGGRAGRCGAAGHARARAAARPRSRRPGPPNLPAVRAEGGPPPLHPWRTFSEQPAQPACGPCALQTCSWVRASTCASLGRLTSLQVHGTAPCPKGAYVWRHPTHLPAAPTQLKNPIDALPSPCRRRSACTAWRRWWCAGRCATCAWAASPCRRAPACCCTCTPCTPPPPTGPSRTPSCRSAALCTAHLVPGADGQAACCTLPAYRRSSC